MRKLFRRGIGFVLAHPVCFGIFCFFFIAGTAAGWRLLLDPGDCGLIPVYLRESGVPFFRCALICGCMYAFILSMLMLSGLWVPAIVLWPASILLRGVMTGAAIKLACSFFPYAVMPMIVVEVILTVPPFFKIAVKSGDSFVRSIKRMIGKGEADAGFSGHMGLCGAYLLAGMGVHVVGIPILVYLFC